MQMRLRSVVVTSLLLVVVGCSGKADDAQAEDPAAAAPEQAAQPTLPTSDPAPAPATTDPNAPPPGSLGTGGGGDAGAEGGGGGTGTGGGTGGGAGGGTKCVNGSVAETEANDTAQTANEIPSATGSFCGKLPTAGDVDFVRFTLPAEAKYLSYQMSMTAPGVKVDFTVGDKTFGPGQALVFVPGGVYVAKITTTGAAPVDYRLDIEIKK